MTVALAALAVFVGAALQSATGFGFSLVAAPILFAVLGPQEAVGAGVLLGLLLNGLTLATERRRPVVLGRDARRLVAWSVPGLVLGALALRELPERPLSALVGLAVLAGLAVRLRGGAVAAAPARRGTRPPRVPRAAPWRPRTPSAARRSPSTCSPAAPRRPPCATRWRRCSSPSRCSRCRCCSRARRSRCPPRVWALLVAALAGQLAGRRAFAWLQGERYERAVLAVLVLSALAALAASVL